MTRSIPAGAKTKASVLDLRVGPVICLLDILRTHGQDPSVVFAAAGVDEGLFQNPESRIEMSKLGKLVSVASQCIGRDDLGLIIANSFGPETLGILLPLACEGPDVRTALLNIVRLLHHNDRSAFLTFKEMEDDAILRYELREPGFEGDDIVLTGTIGIAHRVVLALSGEKRFRGEARLSMKKPRNVAPYDAFFEAPVRFDCVEDALIFPRRWLNNPVAPPSIRPDAVALPKEAWEFPDHVRHQIAMRVGLEPTTSPVIAEALGLSRRALDRRLAGYGLTCNQLIDEVRFGRSRRLLMVGDAPLSEISLALGYSDQSNFSRAFRGWTGVSPQQWRDNLKKSERP